MGHLLSSEQNVVRLREMGREISYCSDLLALWRIFRFLRKQRPDVVHTHTAKAGALGRVAARMAGVPVIVHTYHGHVFHGYFSTLRTRVYLTIERALGRLSTQVIAISESQREELSFKYRVLPKEKIAVVPNGFNLAQFRPQGRDLCRKSLGLAPDQFAVIWAGRMAPVKDVLLLGEVIRKAAASASKAHFVVVGDGEERDALSNLVQGFNNVTLLGWRQDMERIWSAADAAILTSRNEGTPTALIEAMAAGLPWVATHVGAVRDLAVGVLRPMPNGFGVRAENGFLTARTADALWCGVQQLQSDPRLCKTMGSIGQAFATERFSSGRLVEELDLLYLKLMQQERVSRRPAKSIEQITSHGHNER
jgi:glycosyltransferase involved in cell wall biosynthesis